MSTDTLDLAKALCDVRRAYRLLQAYHRRVNDLLYTVNETLSGCGLDFERWAPTNVWLLPKATKPFFLPHSWAWDQTPTYRVECEWGDRENGKARKRARRVHLEVVADTGFELPENGEPDPGQFKAAEDCATELRIDMWFAPVKEADWDGAWKQLERLPHPRDGAVQGVTVGAVQYTYRYLVVNVAELVSESAVKTKLLAPLEERLNARA